MLYAQGRAREEGSVDDLERGVGAEVVAVLIGRPQGPDVGVATLGVGQKVAERSAKHERRIPDCGLPEDVGMPRQEREGGKAALGEAHKGDGGGGREAEAEGVDIAPQEGQKYVQHVGLLLENGTARV